MKRRWLLIVAVALLGLVNIWFASEYIRDLLFAPKAEPLDVRPSLTREEPIAVYPSAVRVNLLIKNASLNGAEASTSPSGIDLTTAQRQKFEQSIKKIIQVRPAGKDYPGGIAAACFIPHHYFRYYNSMGKKVGEIEICFCCAGGQAEPDLAEANAISYDVDAIESLVKEMNLPTEVGC